MALGRGLVEEVEQPLELGGGTRGVGERVLVAEEREVAAHLPQAQQRREDEHARLLQPGRGPTQASP